jgi:hypothetical protein
MAKKLADFIQQHERNVQKKGFGYPATFISELLEITLKLNSEKKKWKKLAQERKEALTKINHIILLSNISPEPEESNESE